MNYIIDDLKPLARPMLGLKRLRNNPRVHDERSIKAIKSSLSAFKQTKPIVLASDGITIIAGNGTHESAEILGWEYIAAVNSGLHKDSQQARAYSIADNRTADLSRFDHDIVSGIMRGLDSALALATGFVDEITSGFPELSGDGNPVDVSPSAETTITQSGSIGVSDPQTLIESPPTEDRERLHSDSDRVPSDSDRVPSGGDRVPSGGDRVPSDSDRVPSGGDRVPSSADRVPSIRYDLVFTDNEEQQEFFAFTRWLRTRYPDIDTVGGRIAEWLRTEGPECR